MERFWNFLFYATWILLRDVSSKFITLPIHNIVIRMYPKGKKKSLKEYQRYVKQENKLELNLKYNASVNYAFKFMLMTTSFVFCTLLITFLMSLHSNEKFSFYFGLFTGNAISICINYYFLYYKDKYLNYFKAFNERTTLKRAYITAVVIHLIPLVILILLAYTI